MAGARFGRIHRLELPEQLCRECGGDGGASDCAHCGGSGVWRSAKTLEFGCFRFHAAGRAYCWHQPRASVEFAPASGLPPAEWHGLGGEKPVALPRRKFAYAKELLRWVIDAAGVEDEPAAGPQPVVPAPRHRPYPRPHPPRFRRKRDLHEQRRLRRRRRQRRDHPDREVTWHQKSQFADACKGGGKKRGKLGGPMHNFLVVLAFAGAALTCHAEIFIVPFDSFTQSWSAIPAYPGPMIGVSMPLCFGEPTQGPQTCMHDPDNSIPAHREWTPADPGFNDIAALLTNGQIDAMYFWEPWGHFQTGSLFMVATGAWEYALFPDNHDLVGYQITGITRDVTHLDWSYNANEFRFTSTGQWSISASYINPPEPPTSVPEGRTTAHLLLIGIGLGFAGSRPSGHNASA